MTVMLKDVNAKDGKGQGGGTRTIYSEERPTHVAKSRRPYLRAAK